MTRLLLLLPLLVAACAGTGGVRAPDPLRVAPAGLDAYWIRQPSPPLPLVDLADVAVVCVVVEYTIDASGQPRDVAVVASRGGLFRDIAAAQVRTFRFAPSPTNADRIAVTTRRVVSWARADMAHVDETLAECDREAAGVVGRGR